MRPTDEHRVRLYLGLAAVWATAIGHSLAYRVAAPDPHHRRLLLEATGHGYWSIFSAVALGALVMGVGGYLSRRARRSARGARPIDHRMTWLGLASVQTIAFLGLETAERVASGAWDGVAALATEPSLAIGVGLQVVLAAIVLRVLAFLDGVVEWLVSPRPVALRGDRAADFLSSSVVLPRTAVAARSWSERGPPR